MAGSKPTKAHYVRLNTRDSRVPRQSPTEADPGLDQASGLLSLLAKPSMIIRQQGREG